MSLQLVQQYYAKVDRLIKHGGSRNETAVRPAFQTLIESYCSIKNLELIPELDYKTTLRTTVKPDGTLKDALRQSWGFWESKDQFDTLDEEIAKKLAKGYPSTNILFEDTKTAVLIQNGKEVVRATVADATSLHTILTRFVSYEPKEVQTFRAAIEEFKNDLPYLLFELRDLIEQQASENATFFEARATFLELCQSTINPDLTLADVREMLIQHILTEEIFITIFDDAQFHRENNIARELQVVIATFFTGIVRRNIIGRIDPYYQVIKAAASGIADHHEKQRFLKVIYENFYKAYNPSGADRLGIFYTPNEIVRFMIEATDFLTNKAFGKGLGDRNVDILDPATGTGTFITELIDYLPSHCLAYKYEQEIFCNEVAILPYYIANLNIEYTYAQKMEAYAEFRNICFVDTLDNLGFAYSGKQGHLFELAAENLERIKRQNQSRISVIIGNPPYRANQESANDNNPNRKYPEVDRRIKETYIKYSNAKKTKQYDLFTRFLRWASDRLDMNGIIAFVTNRAFIDAKQADGFRKVVAEEFNEIYIIDLKGDASTSGERRRREGGNIFNNKIKVGIAVYFLVRREGVHGSKIFYNCVSDCERSEAKKAYLRDNKFSKLPFTHIIPDKNYNWIDLDKTAWTDLLPTISEKTKTARVQAEEQAIFKLFSLGVSTNRDEWVFDFDKEHLGGKIEYFVQNFNHQVRTVPDAKKTEIKDHIDYSIKWSEALKTRLFQRRKLIFDKQLIIPMVRRPFVKQWYYADKGLSDRLTANHSDMFGASLTQENVIIAVNVGDKLFNVLASKHLVDLHFNGDTQCMPLYRYDKSGARYSNITQWSVKQFQSHYSDNSISDIDIFHYVYAVLHNHSYRETYNNNLKRDYPRIPFYTEFRQWIKWGQQLMSLHLEYETATPYPLRLVEVAKSSLRQPMPSRPNLKVDKKIMSSCWTRLRVYMIFPRRLGITS